MYAVKGSVGLAAGGTTSTSRRRGKGGSGGPAGGVPHQMRIAEGRAAEDPPQLGGAVAAAAAAAAASSAGSATPTADQGRPGPAVRPARDPSPGGREAVEGRPARQGPAHPHPPWDASSATSSSRRSRRCPPPSSCRQGHRQAQTVLTADAGTAQYRRSDRCWYGWGQRRGWC